MKTKQILLNIPEKMLSEIDARAGKGMRGAFIRDALAEKLSRDFGVLVVPTLARTGQGVRSDLVDPSADTLEKLRKQAAKARESRWNKK